MKDVPVLLPSMFLMPSTCALRMPMVMKSCGMMPRAPLKFLGESSPRYIGTTLDERPADRELKIHENDGNTLLEGVCTRLT